MVLPKRSVALPAPGPQAAPTSVGVCTATPNSPPQNPYLSSLLCDQRPRTQQLKPACLAECQLMISKFLGVRMLVATCPGPPLGPASGCDSSALGPRPVGGPLPRAFGGGFVQASWRRAELPCEGWSEATLSSLPHGPLHRVARNLAALRAIRPRECALERRRPPTLGVARHALVMSF